MSSITLTPNEIRMSEGYKFYSSRVWRTYIAESFKGLTKDDALQCLTDMALFVPNCFEGIELEVRLTVLRDIYQAVHHAW